MKKLLLTILMLITVGAIAAPSTITLQFDEPTTNVDLTSLTDLSFYQGYCSTTQGGPYTAVNTMPAPLPQPPLLSTLPITLDNCMTTTYGNVYYVLTAMDLSGNESPQSNEAVRSFLDDVAPAAPSDLR